MHAESAPGNICTYRPDEERKQADSCSSKGVVLWTIRTFLLEERHVCSGL